MMDTALYILAVAAGGFFGAISRYWLLRVLTRNMKYGNATALLIINLLGTLILGSVFGDITDVHSDFEFVLVTVGFCGSFTTFSSLCGQLLDFRQRRHTGRMIGYVILNFALGSAVFCGGLYLGEFMHELIL